MCKRISVFTAFFIVILSLFLVTSLALAKGKGRGGSNPPGWDKGEKKGWNSDVPPGIEKKGSQSIEENASEEKPIIEEEVEKEEGAGTVTQETESADEAVKEKDQEKAKEKEAKKEKRRKDQHGKEKK
jgi:hypothetical protein